MKKHLYLLLSAACLLACTTWGTPVFGYGDIPSQQTEAELISADHVGGKEIGGLSLFPNPASDYTNISFSLNTGGVVVIKFFDLLGKEVTTVNEKVLAVGNYKLSVNVSDFSPGIYFCSITTGTTTMTERLIVRRD